jgi:radical SAM superfamily enzyme YgiQ (UPF0313 family)
MSEIVFINPNGREENYQVLAQDLAAHEPPIWALMLAQYVKSCGHSVKILDASVEGWNAEETARQTLALNPILVVVVVYGQNPSASTQLMPATIALVKEINNQKSFKLPKTLLIGGHIAALPKQSLEETGADFVSVSEGFDAILEALQQCHPDILQYGSKDQLVIYDSMLQKLDKKVFAIKPGWDLVDMSKYRAHNWHAFGYNSRDYYASIYTTLGCPFSCEFCAIQAPFRAGEKLLDMKKNSYRAWTVDWVLEQFSILHSKGIKHLKISDELFLFDKKRVEAICDGMIERGYSFNIWAYARLNILDDVLLTKMKRAGINWLGVGIESANNDVRGKSNKNIKQNDILDGVKRIQAVDIAVAGNYMFGLPDDTFDTMQETLDLAIELNTEWANFNCCVSFPGSKLYDECIKNGVKLPESWSGYSYYGKDAQPLDTKYVSGKDVLKFRDEAFIKYFDRYEYRTLILDKFGCNAVCEINDMLDVELKRND